MRRVVVGYEAGLDGFWIARALRERGIEVYVMHPASISVERRGRRAKTDRIDVDILLRALLGWLRGEPRQLHDGAHSERGRGGYARAGASARGPDGGALAQWFLARTAGAKGRMKKIMAVALARKLLVALWRYVESGVIPDGVRLAAA